MTDQPRSPAPRSSPEDLRQIADDFARLGSDLASSGHDTPFEAVTALAARRVPAALACSITTLSNGQFASAAPTDDVAERADHMQYDLGSGPCIDAVLDQTTYQPRDLAHDQRWPEFGRRAAHELGLRSMLSFRMNLEPTDMIAGLNFYADKPDAFDQHDLAEGLLLTTHAAQAVTAAHLHERSENLQRALKSNREIGTAIGVLVAIQKVTAEQAFDLLRIASQKSNRKLHDIALDVIDTGTLDLTPHHRN